MGKIENKKSMDEIRRHLEKLVIRGENAFYETKSCGIKYHPEKKGFTFTHIMFENPLETGIETEGTVIFTNIDEVIDRMIRSDIVFDKMDVDFKNNYPKLIAEQIAYHHLVKDENVRKKRKGRREGIAIVLGVGLFILFITLNHIFSFHPILQGIMLLGIIISISKIGDF